MCNPYIVIGFFLMERKLKEEENFEFLNTVSA